MPLKRLAITLGISIWALCTLGACSEEPPPPATRQETKAPEETDSFEEPVVSFFVYNGPPLVENSFRVQKLNKNLPVDFIMIVDNSGSMSDTAEQVRKNLHKLGQRLNAKGIDYRFVMIAERGTTDTAVCIKPPLGGSNCGNTSKFKHINQRIESRDAFGLTVTNYSKYKNFIRKNSLLQIIVVTDDDSDMSWSRFKSKMRSYGHNDIVLHGIIATRNDGCVSAVGRRYLKGIRDTRGAKLHICKQNWGNVIKVIFDATVSRLKDSFKLKKPPFDETDIQVFIKKNNQNDSLRKPENF